MSIREIVTELAQNTYDYSLAQGVPGTTWPFLDPMSVTYLVDGDSATSIYEHDSHAVDGGQHLLFDGMGAIIAFLATGMEVVP